MIRLLPDYFFISPHHHNPAKRSPNPQHQRKRNVKCEVQVLALLQHFETVERKCGERGKPAAQAGEQEKFPFGGNPVGLIGPGIKNADEKTARDVNQ